MKADIYDSSITPDIILDDASKSYLDSAEDWVSSDWGSIKSWFTSNTAIRKQQSNADGTNTIVYCNGVNYNVYSRTTIGAWTVSAITFTIQSSITYALEGEIKTAGEVAQSIFSWTLDMVWFNNFYGNVAQFIQNFFSYLSGDNGISESNTINCVISELVGNYFGAFKDGEKLTISMGLTPLIGLLMELLQDYLNLLIFSCVTGVPLDACGSEDEYGSGNCAFPLCTSACQDASGCAETSDGGSCTDDSDCVNGLCAFLSGDDPMCPEGGSCPGGDSKWNGCLTGPCITPSKKNTGAGVDKQMASRFFCTSKRQLEQPCSENSECMSDDCYDYILYAACGTGEDCTGLNMNGKMGWCGCTESSDCMDPNSFCETSSNFSSFEVNKCYQLLKPGDQCASNSTTDILSGAFWDKNDYRCKNNTCAWVRSSNKYICCNGILAGKSDTSTVYRFIDYCDGVISNAGKCEFATECASNICNGGSWAWLSDDYLGTCTPVKNLEVGDICENHYDCTSEYCGMNEEDCPSGYNIIYNNGSNGTSSTGDYVCQGISTFSELDDLTYRNQLSYTENINDTMSFALKIENKGGESSFQLSNIKLSGYKINSLNGLNDDSNNETVNVIYGHVCTLGGTCEIENTYCTPNASQDRSGITIQDSYCCIKEGGRLQWNTGKGPCWEEINIPIDEFTKWYNK